MSTASGVHKRPILESPVAQGVDPSSGPEERPHPPVIADDGEVGGHGSDTEEPHKIKDPEDQEKKCE